MLTEQLKQQIATEAETNVKDFKDANDYDAGVIYGYKEGYEIAGEIYAEKWQEAEERANRAEKALRDIANPIPYLQKKAEGEGGVLNGFVFQVASDPSFLKSIAVDALTQKQAGDERRL